ncbi:hypothetical protein [Rhodocyclus purpureus]|uniref:hypothetical protein n=1 Tax=Rhodocyclus purpureus TaxID=1067 RepID=UPI001914ADF4|nr:hypothetical protein [Rhodocyclus purpureus]
MSSPASGQDKVQRAAVSQEDFGQWGIVGYRYTAWDEVFPELKALTQAVTGKRVGFGLMMAWFSQRHMVSQYLRFCGTHFPQLAIPGALAAANNLMDALDAVHQRLPEILDSAGGAIDPTGRLEGALRPELRFSLQHYSFILKNYPWLKRVPFGAVPVVSDGTHYLYQPQRIPSSSSPAGTPGPLPIAKVSVHDNPFPAAALLQGAALRLYPIITSMNDGRTPAFFWANIDVGLGQDRQAPVAAMQIPQSGAQGGRLGMLSGSSFDQLSLDRQWKQQAPDRLWNGVPVRPEGENWKALWTCVDYSGDALRGIPKAFIRNYSPLQAGSAEIEIACPDLSPTPPAADSFTANRPPPQVVDVLLVPVGYEDAKSVDPIFGGEPMWPEPMTDRILSALAGSVG